MRGMGPGRMPGGGHRLGRDDELEKVDLKKVIRLLKYLKPYKGMVFICLLLCMLATFLILIPPRVMGIIIDQAIGGKQLNVLYIMAIVFLGVHVLSHVLGGFKSFLMGKLGQKVVFSMWRDIYGNLQRLCFTFYDNNETGDIMSRVTSDVAAVERAIVNGADDAVISVITLIGITIILFWMNLRLALIAMIPIPALIVLMWFFTRTAHKIFRKLRKKMGAVSALLQDSISGIREIKSFGREEYEIEKFSEKGSDYINTNIKAIKVWSIFFPAMAITTLFGSFLVIWFGGKTVITTSSLSTGQFISFLFYLGMFYQPIRQLNMVNHMLQHAMAAGERIFEVIDAVPTVKEAPDAENLPSDIKGNIVFQNVHFHYLMTGLEEKNREKVLHGINIEANPGEVVALVGPTGAGKTTIVSLIPRFYDVTEGAVLFDGIDVRKLRLKSLRENIGIVMQEPFIFNGTIGDNILYGKANASMEEVVEAAKLANAHEFIEAMPEGYESLAGERGVKLSVGEKQRIAIARTLLKSPPVLILDEATSSVDNKTEMLIHQAIDHLLRKRTSFVIAHRLSTVMNADKILVIQGGRIAETGTHKELLDKKGIYNELYNSQWRTLMTIE